MEARIPAMAGWTMTPRTRARLLLVEDDPVSRAFLAQALAPLARVDAVEGAAAAIARVREGPPFDLWLLDSHLPDGDGIALLRRLRLHAAATPALAHTADPDPRLAVALRAAGFQSVLLKPLRPAALRAAVAQALGDDRIGGVAEAPAPAWQAPLWRLFLAELPAQRDAVLAACTRGDWPAAAALLHRLRGSCALVGITALEDAVRALQAAPGDASALRAFDAAVAGVLRLQDAAEVGQQVP
jgi:CheY-like chemotaxis protein/HPt (histidine-containing phosphotransfer) domain-containing protein